MSDFYPDNPDFDAFYESHKDKFPPGLWESLGKAGELMRWYKNSYRPLLDQLPPRLHTLQLKHHAAFEKEGYPRVKEHLKTINSNFASSITIKITGLLRDEKDEVNLREKYPRFEEFKQFYGKPRPPKQIDDTYQKYFPRLSAAEWEEYKRKENESLLQFYEWKEKRKQEFFDIVQSLLFRYLPVLNNMESDTLIIYGLHLGDEHEIWKQLCEEAETIIDYEMPDDTIDLPYKEFQERCSAAFNKNPHYESELLKRRIAGERI